MIEKIYGVTLHQSSGHVSIYEATLSEDTVVVKKIEENYSLDNSIAMGEELKNGHVLGVMSDARGFVMYNQGSRTNRPDGVSTYLWGGNTSPFVGLFTELGDAQECLKCSKLTHWDERFLDKSIVIIEQIALVERTTYKIRLDNGITQALENNRLRKYLVAASCPKENID